MMPPYAPADKRPLPALSQWAVRHAFDSAAACERKLAKEIAAVAAHEAATAEEEQSWQLQERLLGETSWSGWWGGPAIKLQQCIATDDPRLAPRTLTGTYAR
jgi:hypothetical protein